jgi:putative acyl-CoA dehydrogenase
LWTELEAARGVHSAYDRALESLRSLLTTESHVEPSQARILVERLALALQAGLLFRAGSPMAAAFCASRLQAGHGLVFGTLAHDTGFEAILDRARPS